MDILWTTLKRGRDVWDRVNMPESEFHDRVVELRRVMGNEDIDVALLYGEAWKNQSNSCYFTNHRPVMNGAICVIPREGEVAVIYSGSGRELKYAERVTWIRPLRPAPDIVASCASYLAELGLGASKVGMVGFEDLMPHAELLRLEGYLLDCTVVDIGPQVCAMRSVKSAKERDQVHRASRLLVDSLDGVVSTPFLGESEVALGAALDRLGRLEGAEDVRVLLGVSGAAELAFGPCDHGRLLERETVVINLAAAYERYWAEVIRTFAVADDALVPTADPTLDRAYRSMVKLVVPGKSISQFCGEVDGLLSDYGRAFAAKYGLGHGVGMSREEDPLLFDSSKDRLQEGMCLYLQLAGLSESNGVVVVGDTYVVEEDGAIRLT